MTNGYLRFAQEIRDILEANGVFVQAEDVQHATKFSACFGFARAFILVFNTGTILVQGSASPLKTWLQEVKRHLEASTTVPRFTWTVLEMQDKLGPDGEAARVHQPQPALDPVGTSVRKTHDAEEADIPWLTTWQQKRTDPPR